VWLETNFYLFTVTAIVSVLHSLFEILAFKNDIQFWNSKEDLEGISVKSLYISICMSFVITLYLFDNETSLLILGPQCASIFVDLWKLKQASTIVATDKFPYFSIQDKDTYLETDTKKYD
jgi:hypothetical protein